jgi:hypothetical protein
MYNSLEAEKYYFTWEKLNESTENLRRRQDALANVGISVHRTRLCVVYLVLRHSSHPSIARYFDANQDL